MTTSSRDHNPLALRGLEITDQDYINDWNTNPLTMKYGMLDKTMANTPALTDAVMPMIKQWQKENKDGQ